MRFESILIITYGRSGSTLLQGVLNSIDGCLIRGENYNFCFHLYKSFQCLQNAKQFVGKTPEHSWYGAHLLKEEVFLNSCRRMVKTLLLTDQAEGDHILCYGFKEIRYPDVGQELPRYLEFLRRLFPRPAFVFNTRNLENVAKSAWFRKQDPEVVVARLRETERIFHEYLTRHGNGFHITYEDVVAKSDRLSELFRFLGAEYLEGRIDRVLARPHSFPTKPRKAAGGKGTRRPAASLARPLRTLWRRFRGREKKQ